MFCKTLRLYKQTNIAQNLVRKFSAAATKERWDLLSAVCLERKPVITQELTEIEKEFKDYLAQIEVECSLRNDFEIKHELESKQLELLKKGADIDVEVNLKNTTQDFLDASLDELNKFVFAKRTSDQDGDLKSLKRKLDKHLVLVVNQKIGDKKHYLLPQDKRLEGETLRQTAERVLKTSCGGDLKAQIYGNAPMGFYNYKYPQKVREGDVVGAKVFIYFARYVNGEMPAKGIDFKWLDREELNGSLPENYRKSVNEMLLSE